MIMLKLFAFAVWLRTQSRSLNLLDAEPFFTGGVYRFSVQILSNCPDADGFQILQFH